MQRTLVMTPWTIQNETQTYDDTDVGAGDTADTGGWGSGDSSSDDGALEEGGAGDGWGPLAPVLMAQGRPAIAVVMVPETVAG